MKNANLQLQIDVRLFRQVAVERRTQKLEIVCLYRNLARFRQQPRNTKFDGWKCDLKLSLNVAKVVAGK